jgi:hypothetical protein
VDNFGLFVFLLVCLAVGLIAVAGFWRVFEKAGQPGWGCLIPIYNVVLLVRIAGKPEIWVLWAFVPVVNLVVIILVALEIAKKFGQGSGFGVGMALMPVIFYPILGFGNAQYQR